MLLAGPILRRVDAKSVNIWIALDENASITAALKDDTSAIPGTSSDLLTYPIGNKLVIKLVTFTPTVPLQPDKVYSYDLQSSGQSILGTLLKKEPFLGYALDALPSFVLPATEIKDLVVAHGSCRKMHGDGHEALSNLDDIIKKDLSDPKKRVQQLFLTGDQIYADEIPRFALWAMTASARKLVNADETLPLPATEIEGESYPAKHILPELATPGLRTQLLRHHAQMTTSSGEAHLMSFGEFCLGYLYAWSPDVWEKPFLDAVVAMRDDPSPENVKKHWEIFQEQTDFNIFKVAEKEYLLFFHEDDKDSRAELARIRKLIKNDPDPDNRHDTIDLFIATQLSKQVDSYLEAHKRVMAAELREVADFLETLPKVRRVMANTPTYMTFDDHEITDDWNISRQWKNEVYRNPLGKSIIRNGLMAYALFQDLGNTPDEYRKPQAESKKADLMEHAKTYSKTTDFTAIASTVEAIDKLLGLTNSDVDSEVKWHYLIESGPRVKTLFLDTRTRRSFNTLFSPPGLLDKKAFDEQFKFPAAPQSDEMLFLISACPAIGLSIFEELIYPVATSAKGLFEKDHTDGTHFGFVNGQLKFDNEAWYMNGEAFEKLLSRLSVFKKVVLFSGDVHFGFTTVLDYFKKGETVPSRYIQLVSSPLKNLWKKNIRLFQSGFVQGIFAGFDGKLEKFGWNEPPDLTGAAVSVVNQRRLREKPAVIDNFGLQSPVTASPDPDWRYRLQVAADTSNQIAFAEPFDKTKTEHLKAIARRFHDDFKIAKSRRLMFAAHVCTVSFENDSLKHTFYFKTPDEKQTQEMIHNVSLTPSEADKKTPELGATPS
jgi:hypothetical protein